VRVGGQERVGTGGIRLGAGELGAVKGLGGAGGCSQGRHTVSMLVAKSIRSGELLPVLPAAPCRQARGSKLNPRSQFGLAKMDDNDFQI